MKEPIINFTEGQQKEYDKLTAQAKERHSSSRWTTFLFIIQLLILIMVVLDFFL